MRTKISLYKNITHTKSDETIDFDLFLAGVREGTWQDRVLQIRVIKDKDLRQKAKAQLPYVTVSGVFTERSVKGLKAHSGFLSMDVDNIAAELEGVRMLLSQDAYVYAAFTSVSGTGMCVIFKIDPERHLDAFYGIADYLIKRYQIIIDPSGKDVSRPRYVSYDPDIVVNEQAAMFKKYLPKPKERQMQSTIFVQTEFDEVVKKMVEARVNCVEDYRDWLAVGFGLADQFGEAGRGYFHALSSCSAKYESSMCDRQYTYCVNRAGGVIGGGGGNRITIATIYYYAKQAGIDIYSARTKKIAGAAGSMKRSGISQEDAVANLEKFEGISKQESEGIVKQAFAARTGVGELETLSVVEDLIMWLKHNYDLRRNVITRRIENGGKAMDDVEFNSLFIRARIQFPKDLSFELFWRTLMSDYTPVFNPFIEFYEKNQHLQYAQEVEEMWGCLSTDSDERLRYFGTKWLVSIVSSIYGSHSPLMLVFAGDQNIGKTETFRRLLPVQLHAQYYAESKLDAGKDDEILMTQKLIVMDDEMGGKNKAESKRLKELLSKQTFSLREPYGRTNVDLQRLAVLCGTTNDLAVLNDPTGNTRIIPVQILGVNKERLNGLQRDALFVQLFRMYKEGFDWKLNQEDIRKLNEGTESFEVYTAEYELLIQWFEIPSAGTPADEIEQLSTTEIKNRLEERSEQRLILNKIGAEMKRLGYEKTMKRVQRMPKQVYFVRDKLQSASLLGLADTKRSTYRPNIIQPDVADDEPLPF